ncbi:kintoun [Brachionus plicatilis]|uniref:Protein kintoun n=1 Tax=Brachionus plicatilis TaxID=10195 RepID=A0A3M7QYQ1_BRAPC|nr:kintoun [Brachionus plicatilis]
MSSNLKNKFDELNMTQDEIKRFTEAMKKEEFRKLLVEYAEEISDPKNRELYEQEITKLEEERGMDVVFIHPEPGYCIKTSQDGGKKCFINICKNSSIQKPTAKRDYNNNKGGLYWQIPHSCSPAREDTDKSNKEVCKVYDVVFHPDAYRMGETSQRFNDLLKDSAMDTIEKNFSVRLDKVNAKILKNISFKGKPTASVIRRPKSGFDLNSDKTSSSTQDPVEKIVDELKVEYLKSQRDKATKKMDEKPIYQNEPIEDKFTKPIYKIIYTGQADIQDYVNTIAKNCIESTRPKEIKISIELPLCKSSADVILDIFEKRLYLESSNPFYKLDLNLSYPINEKEAKAKFDKSKKTLNVILPVIPFTSKIENQFEKLEESVAEKNEVVTLPETSPSLPEIEPSLCPVEENSTDIVQQVKYLLPSEYQITQFVDSLQICIQQENYNQDSIKIQKISQNSLLLYFECISQSGSYLTYYRAHFNFFKNDHIYSFKISDQEFLKNIKITPLKTKFEIEIPNSDDDDDGCLTCLVSSTQIEEFKKDLDTSSKLIQIYNVKKEPRKNETSVSNSDQSNFDCKKKFITNFQNITPQEDSDDENNLNFHIACDDEDEQTSSSTDFKGLSNQLDENSCSNSSINGSSLKSILKKSRSISEGEGSIRSSIESNSNEGSQELCSMKKTVSFSKQVVRNIFKPGSTITGMKKPSSSKNKKKNQKRNRTLSDPCHSNDQISNDLIQQQIRFRQRGFSESSDDVTNSAESISEIDSLTNNQARRKNKKGKKKNQAKEEKNEFDMEKMIQLKSQGILPIDDQSDHKTGCAFKFKNKIAQDLD